MDPTKSVLEVEGMKAKNAIKGLALATLLAFGVGMVPEMASAAHIQGSKYSNHYNKGKRKGHYKKHRRYKRKYRRQYRRGHSHGRYHGGHSHGHGHVHTSSCGHGFSPFWNISFGFGYSW